MDYYDSSLQHNEESNNSSHEFISVSDDTSYYVLYCNFINQNSLGAIKFKNNADSTNLLLEATVFNNCSSTEKGGSVYFETGEVIQEHVCYYKSISSNQGHAYSCSASPNKRNYFKFSSVFDCGDYEYIYSIDQDYGTVQIDNINLTNNKAYYGSSYFIEGGKSGSFIQYSSFVNQSENDEDAFSYYRGEPFVVKQCNFIKNKAVSGNISKLIFITSNSNMEVVECCFKENSCDYTFYSFSDSNITVKNCYCDEIRTGANDNATVKIESSKTNSDPVSLGFFVIGKCEDFVPRAKSKVCKNCFITQEIVSVFVESFTFESP